VYNNDLDEDENKELMGKIEEVEGFQPTSFKVQESVEGLAILHKLERFDANTQHDNCAFSSAIDVSVISKGRLI
jgi:hypothetical protein